TRVGLEVVPLTDEDRAAVADDVESLSGQALRTLGVAYRPLSLEEYATLGGDETPEAGTALEQDLIFVGTVGIIDPPRPEAIDAVAEAHRAGIRVVMITGDHPATAVRIADDLGVRQ